MFEVLLLSDKDSERSLRAPLFLNGSLDFRVTQLTSSCFPLSSNCLKVCSSTFRSSADVDACLLIELSYLKQPLLSISIPYAKNYPVTKERVAHRRASAEIACVGHISESGKVGVEGFTDLLIPLIEFEMLVRLVYITCEYSSNLEIIVSTLLGSSLAVFRNAL